MEGREREWDRRLRMVYDPYFHRAFDGEVIVVPPRFGFVHDDGAHVRSRSESQRRAIILMFQHCVARSRPGS
jgi:hypothetical protein